MVIFAISLSVGLGLQLVPQALQHLPDTAKILATSGLLPAAFLAIRNGGHCIGRGGSQYLFF